MSAVKKDKQRQGAPIGCKSVRATTKTIHSSGKSLERVTPRRESAVSSGSKSVKARTISLRDLTREQNKAKRQGHPQLEIIPYQRPAVREDCRNKERPCLYVSCVHHLYLDVTDKGSIVFNYPDKEPWELEETCSLDLAEKEDGLTLEEIGDYLNLTRERVRQVERSALSKLKAGGKVER